MMQKGFAMKRHILIFAGSIFLSLSALAQTPAADSVAKVTEKRAQKETKPMDAHDNFVVNVSREKDFSSFFKALQKGELIGTFYSAPITVFLPDNTAFSELSNGKIDSLMTPQRKYDLIALMTYHALPGTVTIHKLTKLIHKNKGSAVLTTLSGSKLIATIGNANNVILIDEGGNECFIKKADVKQHNGVVHMVSTVLMPRFKNI